MSPPNDLAQLVDTGQREWTPKHGTYTQTVKALYDLWNPVNGVGLDRYNATTRRIRQLVADASRQGVRLRALGAGWSFSRAPATDGWLVNTKPLNLYFRLGESVVDSGYRGDRAGLRFVQCGCSMLELARHLRQEMRSIRTMGASNGQTIAGALSTGTHGSILGVGGIPDYVVGLHIVVGPERHVWLERASYPVMKKEFADRLGAELVRNDELFNAALVSFGSFGFIHGVMIETDDIFLLECHRKRMKVDAGMHTALRNLDFSGIQLPHGAERPYYFQMVANPYDLDHGAFATTMYRRPFREDYPQPGNGFEGFGPGDDALAFVGLLTDGVPLVIPALTSLLTRAYKEMSGVLGTIGEIFTNTDTRGKTASTALGIPMERVEEALATVLELLRRDGPFEVLVSLRYAKATQATLGWARFAPTTCILEVDGVKSDRTLSLQRTLWQTLVDRGIPHTVHWGKQIGLDATGVRRSYGDAAGRWITARETLLNPATRHIFSSPFLEGLGLST